MITDITQLEYSKKSLRPAPIDFTAIDAPGNIFSKKPSLGKGNSPSAGRYSPHVSPLLQKPKIDSSIRSSSYQNTKASSNNRKNFVFAEEKEELLKNYHKCREIMNSAHEAMLLIKEKMLEVKEKVLNSKIHYVESKMSKTLHENTSDAEDPDLLEEKISHPIIIHGSPEKQNMQDLRYKQDPRKVKIIQKDLLDSVFGLGKNEKKLNKGQDKYVIPPYHKKVFSLGNLK